MTGSNNRWVFSVQPVVVYRTHAQRTAPTVPSCHRQRGVRNKMGSTIDVHAMVTALEKGISDLRQTTIQGDVSGDGK